MKQKLEQLFIKRGTTSKLKDLHWWHPHTKWHIMEFKKKAFGALFPSAPNALQYPISNGAHKGARLKKNCEIELSRWIAIYFKYISVCNLKRSQI